MRSKLKTALTSLLLLLSLAASAQAQPCTVPLMGFGPIDPADGFPQYYLDSNNLGLSECLDFVCDPALGVPNPSKPVRFASWRIHRPWRSITSASRSARRCWSFSPVSMSPAPCPCWSFWGGCAIARRR